MPSPSMIYLVRRAATANDESRFPVMLGQKLPMLQTVSGKRRAEALSEMFAGRRIMAVYSSPLARAVQTARPIAAACAAELVFCSSLTDVDTGAWEGLTTPDILKDARSADLLRDPEAFCYPGGEPVADAYGRATRFFEALAERHAGNNIVVVAHRQINRLIIAHLVTLGLGQAKDIDQDPGCVNTVRVIGGNLELRTVNYTEEIDFAVEDDSHVTSCI